ncbi:MAG: efflux RND transporter permease subunit [Methylobacter sp.]|nr:efflux RND transporter permease subunit [Methylobacter sp.]
MLKRFYQNHVLANLAYALVVLLGLFAYQSLAREEFPDVNQNFMSVWIAVPGLSAEDIEQRVTLPFEQLLHARLADVKMISSTTGAGFSATLLRFNPLDRATFEKRGAELRREVQAAYATIFPKEATIYWVWGDTGSVTRSVGTVLVQGGGDPERFKVTIREVKRELERISGIEKLDYFGYSESEIHIAFHPEQLAGLGLSPLDIADTVSIYLRDEAAGPVALGDKEWLVRVVGSGNLPARLAELSITGAHGVVKLGDIAEIVRGDNNFKPLPRSDGLPTALFSLYKKNAVDAFEVIKQVQHFIDARNAESDRTGVKLLLAEDETIRTRTAISIMEHKAWWGLLLVLLMTWGFLGSRLAALCTLAVPFALGGTFLMLQAAGMTLNTSVLLGVMIALGMLVDYAVVVVEAIAYRIRQGMAALDAALDALHEVGTPVISSFLTTIAAFLPLALLPGFLGGIMRVVPIAVTAALLAALIEALWMLPAHIAALAPVLASPSRFQAARIQASRWLQVRYTRLLLSCLRHPGRAFFPALLAFSIAGAALTWGWVVVDFFPKEPTRSFSVLVKFPPGTKTDSTLPIFAEIEARIRSSLTTDELHIIAAIPPEELRVYLTPNGRKLPEILALIEPSLQQIIGPSEVSIDRQSSGGPQGAPIKAKLTGSDFIALRSAAEGLQAALSKHPAFSNLHSDYLGGAPQLDLRLNGEAIQRSGVAPETVLRTIKLLVRGEVAAGYREGADSIGVRVMSKVAPFQDLNALLRQTVSRPGGGAVPLADLVEAERREGPQMIHHYNYRRVITLEANLDAQHMNVRDANAWIAKQWQTLSAAHPEVKLDLTGEIEDIEESLGGLRHLAFLGLGLIFLILGAQYRSYLQPALILLKVPMAFAGIILGLLLSREPVSLYTLYGGVALAGITVNSAILLFSAANDRVESGMGIVHATFYAARRRLIPILITSLATMAGLLPLAVAGDEASSLWRPVATAIVWGLGFSTLLTLFVVPLIYRLAIGWAQKSTGKSA